MGFLRLTLDGQTLAEVPVVREPPPSGGDDVVLVNSTWKPAGNWGALNLVDVRIMQIDPRRDGVHFGGTGTIRRFFCEQHSGDVAKIHADSNGIVIGSFEALSEAYLIERYGSVHPDCFQAMGGRNVTIRNLYGQRWVKNGSFLFTNVGSGWDGSTEDLPTNIIAEFCTFVGDRDGGIQVRISGSVGCGVRHCLIVYTGGPSLVVKKTGDANGPAAVNPVVVDSVEMTHAEWDAAGQPRHADLWNMPDGTHKPLLDQLLAAGNARIIT